VQVIKREVVGQIRLHNRSGKILLNKKDRHALGDDLVGERVCRDLSRQEVHRKLLL
jgi:hypothetical protein